MPKIERLALSVKLDNGITLTVPFQGTYYAPRSLQIADSDVQGLTHEANKILEKIKEG